MAKARARFAREAVGAEEWCKLRVGGLVEEHGDITGRSRVAVVDDGDPADETVRDAGRVEQGSERRHRQIDRGQRGVHGLGKPSEGREGVFGRRHFTMLTRVGSENSNASCGARRGGRRVERGW